MDKRLIVLTGPTGSGKTGMAIEWAQRLGCDIISADSRQIYRGIPIGTAAPTPEQLAAVKHHFVGIFDLEQNYSAAQYETDVLSLLDELWEKNPTQILCGGSMMYIDAVCNGIDDLPTISKEVREYVLDLYNHEGLSGVRSRLLALDPVSYEKVDEKNPRRNIHAVEICLQSGKRASDLLTGKKKNRDFVIEKYFIDLPREELFRRINNRVAQMVADGLEDEARNVFHLRNLNSLNTVGYKEMFAYFDGVMDRETAIARIAKNTRVYAKKQLTWLKKSGDAKPVK